MHTSMFPRVAEALDVDGFAVIEDHLLPERVAELRREAERLLGADGAHGTRHPPGWDEFVGAGEHSDAVARCLMDPWVLAAAVSQLGPDVELASSGEVDRKRRRSTQSSCQWHADFTWMPFVPRPRPFPWIAAYFFVSDVDEDSGPIWVVPGSHRWVTEPDHRVCERHPEPDSIPGSRPLIGRAGTLALMNNELWHMSPVNRSDEDRILVRVQLKPAWMRPWTHSAPTDSFVRSADDPVGRQLLGVSDYDSVSWEYGVDATLDRYPVVEWLAREGFDVSSHLVPNGRRHEDELAGQLRRWAADPQAGSAPRI